MSERIAEASPRLRARITGAVYLLYFLTAISAEVFVGRARLVAYDAVTLMAYVFYITVTLIFYYMFKLVSMRLSWLAALFSLMGCANDVMGVFNLAPYHASSLVFFGPRAAIISPPCIRRNRGRRKSRFAAQEYSDDRQRPAS